MLRLLMVCGLMLVAARPASAIVWGVKSTADVSIASLPPAHLFSFNETAPANLTDHGVVALATGAPIDVDGLALDAGGQLYGFMLTQDMSGTVIGSSLITIDAATAVASPVGSTLSRNIRGATFDAAGNLWALDAAANELLRIDPITGDAAAGSTVALMRNSLAFDLADSADVAIRADGSFTISSVGMIFSLNPTTGVLTDLTTLLTRAYAGLVWGTELATADVLFGYEVNGGEDIDTFDPANSYARSDYILSFIPSFNAGRGDLAAAVPAPATLTILLMCAAGLIRRR